MPTDGDGLHVRASGQLIGHLRADAGGRMQFAYDGAWLASSGGFAVSLSLPLRAEPYVDGPAHTFFANLLPEGHVRHAVCRRLGLSEDNDLALLRAIGGECAGALSIVDPARPRVDPDDHQYEALSDRRLQSLISNDRIIPLLVGGATTRLSLAGAQDKLPVALLDGQLHLPLSAAPSTHILKLPSAAYKHIAANEAFVTGLAGRIGLDVVRAELLHRTDPPSLLVARYDRRLGDDPWPAARLHQEDLCQALALPPSRKYQQEGGPSLVTAIEVVRSNVRQPVVDVRRLIEWQAFNIVAGNSDGHGKNLSLLFDGAQPRLAPFYDLLSTRAYPKLDRRMAMGVGDRRDPDQIGRAEWTALASALQITPGVVVDLVRGVGDRCAAALTDWTRAFRDEHGAQPALQTLPGEISRRCRRLIRAIA